MSNLLLDATAVRLWDCTEARSCRIGNPFAARRRPGEMTQTQAPKPELSKPPDKRLARWLYPRFWFRAMIYLVVAYVAWLALLYFYWQDRIIFPRYMTPQPRPTLYNAETAVIRLNIETGGQVEAWFIPAPGVTVQTPGPVVVFFHGNGEIIDYQDEIIESYHRLGCSVFLPEYRGYGRSGGKPSEKAICADAVRFYDELTKRSDVDKSRIVFYGRSLGGGVAANLAARRRPAALILQSAFKSVACMAYRVGAPPFLVRHPFRTDRAIAKSDVPVLIFHGTRDEIVPVAHGRKLRDLASQSTYVEYNCGHNDFPGPGNETAYWSAIRDFLLQGGVIKD